jgi:hypothetical protein
MDDRAETSYDYGFEVTDAKVIRVVPVLLAVTIHDPESSADAFRRLWLLSKSGPEEETRNRARRVLKEAIGYQKYKSLSFNERHVVSRGSPGPRPQAHTTGTSHRLIF